MVEANGSAPENLETVDCPVVADLATAIEVLRTSIQSPRPRIITPGIVGTQEFCLICGIFRSEPDPTGVTCGQPVCLAAAGTLASQKAALQAVLDEISKKLKLSDDLDISTAIEDLLKASETSAETASILGIDIQGSEPSSVASNIKSAATKLVTLATQLKEIMTRNHNCA